MKIVDTFNAYAVIRKSDGKIQNLDGGIAKRLAIFETLKDADRDCDHKDEEVVGVQVRIVTRDGRNLPSRR